MVDTAIYIGRFEPVHNGHMALLQRALDSAQQVIVVVGSAWQARSPKNPFTWPEREAMLRNALPEADRSRVLVLPMRDYYNEAVWVQAVRQGVATTDCTRCAHRSGGPLQGRHQRLPERLPRLGADPCGAPRPD